MKIIVASQNSHKVTELSKMLDNKNIELVSLKDMGFSGDIEEYGSSFEENAAIKAGFVCKKFGIPAIADDSGLCVEYLGGKPGIYSARYASTSENKNASDADNIEKLLSELAGLPKNQRKAYFASAICLAFPDGSNDINVFGKCDGYITESIVGAGGFGYDPIFFSTDLNKTFGECSQEEKDRVSHRALAMIALKKELDKLI